MAEKILVGVPNVRERMESWIKDRGGVKIWRSVDLGSRRGPVFTPADQNHKPHYSMMLDRIVVDISEFRFVKEWKEVERFHVAVRRGAQGFKMKCTDASSRRIESATYRHPGSFFRFDYNTQEVVIELPVYEES